MVSKSQLAIDWPVYRPRAWGKPTRARALERPWFGLDTERDAKRGDFVCGYAVGETVQRFEKLPDLIPGTYWVWNLAYDIEGMLRDLDIPEAWAAKSDGSTFPLLDGSACYYHGKRFTLKRGSDKWNFIEASSFFSRIPLSELARKYGYGEKKDVDASRMSLVQYQIDPVYRQLVDDYCIEDAHIVYNAITDLDMGVRALGVELGSTPGATARRFVARLGQFPEIIWRTHKPFLRSYCGGRFEVTKRGVIFGVNQYDIVSAYPWALSECPWLTDSATWRMSRRFSDNALYGSYEVGFDYPDYLGVAPRWRGGVRVYSAKQEKTWLARPEVDWLIRHGVPLTIHRGIEVFDENASDLWRQVILELFNMKRSAGKKPEGIGAKIILNSQYGILIQLVRESGEWVPISMAKNPIDFAGVLALEEPPKRFEAGNKFAPIYAGNLTALTRVKLLDAADEIGPERYIGGHTDSVLCIGTMKNELSDALGGWKLEKTADRAEVCKTGMYSVGDIVKVRGITRKGTPALLWQQTHQRKSRIGIKTALDWRDVSVIQPKIVANNFGVELKRKWLATLDKQTIVREEFIDSEALVCVA